MPREPLSQAGPPSRPCRRRRGEEWFLATGTYSDTTITCSGIAFKLHKMILCRESHYFAEKILIHKDDDLSVDADEADFKGLMDVM